MRFRYSPTPEFFSFFRVLFGVYLTLHFLQLLPDAAELFSKQGVLPDFTVLPGYGVFPNILFWIESANAVQCFIILLSVISFAFTLGFQRRFCALVLWYSWACLLSRNPFISNPSIAFVGLLLLVCAAIPSGEPWALRIGPRERDQPIVPPSVWAGVWCLMAVGYSVSGLHKLGSPSWVDGTAIRELLDNPLSRDTPIRELLLLLPMWVFRCLTWGSLALEIGFMPLALFRRTRPIVWCGIVGMHLGILTVVNFADLTFGMLMVHLFTFDERWIAAASKRGAKQEIVFYDGECGLCNRFVQFVLRIDNAKSFHFAPLQGDFARGVVSDQYQKELSTVVVVDGNGTEYVRSDAVLYVLARMGGIWRVLSWIARAIPRALRDWGYSVVARYRHVLFGKAASCQLPDAGDRGRFL